MEGGYKYVKRGKPRQDDSPLEKKMLCTSTKAKGEGKLQTATKEFMVGPKRDREKKGKEKGVKQCHSKGQLRPTKHIVQPGRLHGKTT